MIPQVVRVLHIVDERTPPDVLDQLRLLAAPGDRAVSVGPPPRWPGAPMAVAAVHRPLGSAQLAGWRMRGPAGSADLLHAWSLEAMWGGRELGLATGRPLVVSLPCIGAPAQVEALRRAMGPGLFRLTVPTESARRELAARGLPAAAVDVLPPAAAPAEDRQAAGGRVRRELGVGDSEWLIVAPDPMVRPAGHYLASWAHAIVRQVMAPVRLLLPGGGPVEEHVRFFAGTTGYDDEVFITRDRFSPAESLAAADLAVFFHEGPVGVAALAKAMAAGLPIAAARTPDVTECLGAGGAAVLVDAGDPRQAAAAVLRLLEDRELAQRLAAAAAARAAELFSTAACRRRLESIYAAAAQLVPR